jgi:hypothetical protein
LKGWSGLDSRRDPRKALADKTVTNLVFHLRPLSHTKAQSLGKLAHQPHVCVCRHFRVTDADCGAVSGTRNGAMRACTSDCAARTPDCR